MEFDLHNFLHRLAAARGGDATLLLDLGDGRPPIPCRDSEQAERIERLWLAFHQTTPEERSASYHKKARVK